MLMAAASVVASAQVDEGTTTMGVPMVKLNNGVLMPRFGLGTFAQPSDSVCEQSCLTALEAGYRHIDTAHAYYDERGVGRAVNKSGVPREEIWVTSKLWPTEYGEGKTACWVSGTDPTINRIAEAHGKTAAQVIIRWHIQEGFSVIPGAWNPDYIKENIQVFDFTLTDEEMRTMRSLNKEQLFFNLPQKEDSSIYLTIRLKDY